MTFIERYGERLNFSAWRHPEDSHPSTSKSVAILLEDRVKAPSNGIPEQETIKAGGPTAMSTTLVPTLLMEKRLLTTSTKLLLSFIAWNQISTDSITIISIADSRYIQELYHLKVHLNKWGSSFDLVVICLNIPSTEEKDFKAYAAIVGSIAGSWTIHIF